MKKALLFVSAALLMAGLTVSCNNNATEENQDSLQDTIAVEEEEPACCEEQTEWTAECEAAATAECDAAMLAAAKEAGQAKCNCYKTDAASVEQCIRAILSERFAQYKNNEAFKKAMNDEFNNCVKAKATDAAKEAGNKAIKAGAEALSKKINK